VWLTVLGVALWCTGFATVGVALGGLLRNQVLTSVAGLTWLVVVEPIVVNLAPASALAARRRGQRLGRAPEDGLLPQWGGALLITAYTAAVALAAALTTMRRHVA
jgi:ABC-2 type transport system permease protein